MTRPRMKTIRSVGSFSCAALLCACGSSAEPSEKSLDLLDPATAQYGQTYAQWAASWIDYIYRYAPPDCLDPVKDQSGEHCELYQAPESPVFFLVGTYGGVAKRTACPVRGDKALFFPLVNAWADNAGLPPDQLQTEAVLKATLDSALAEVIQSELYLTVDGQDIEKLERGVVQTAPYTVHLPAGPNSYTCLGVDGVEGDFPGYTSGYFAMLPPLGPGAHTISFGGAANSAALGQLTFDAQYEFSSP